MSLDRSADAMNVKQEFPGPHDRPFPAEWIDPHDGNDHPGHRARAEQG
jgi:hypothetical protein